MAEPVCIQTTDAAVLTKINAYSLSQRHRLAVAGDLCSIMALPAGGISDPPADPLLPLLLPGLKALMTFYNYVTAYSQVTLHNG